ncbi:response regulator [Candidatus Bipolaricaulota bacterium]|nr:response regulator [Candidatus Bipolaricaulota bacterium]
MAAGTILVIEDQIQNQYLMKYLLEAHGFRVVLSNDGPEGIHAASIHIPDLILLDIQLPVMSGHDVAKALQSDSLLASIPIVAVTSYAMPGDREQVLASGCTGYIEKPINPATFVDSIRDYLKLRKPTDERRGIETPGGCR